MRRSCVLVLVLFALLWQSATLARAGSTVNALADMEHAALHWQEQGHHHDEDGSYHLDDSSDAVQHVLSDQVGATVALLQASPHGFLPVGSVTPGGLHPPSVPDPDLEGLLRPPRPRS